MGSIFALLRGSPALERRAGPEKACAIAPNEDRNQLRGCAACVSNIRVTIRPLPVGFRVRAAADPRLPSNKTGICVRSQCGVSIPPHWVTFAARRDADLGRNTCVPPRRSYRDELFAVTKLPIRLS